MMIPLHQAAAWWESLHDGFERCMALTNADNAARSFWSSHQSFFKQLLNSIKCRFAIAEAEKALARGECVVVGCAQRRSHSGQP